MSTYEAARTDVAKRIEETMAGLRKFVSRDRQSPLELTVSLLEDTASLGRSVIYLDRRERQREWADDYRKAVTDKLEFVAIGAAEFLLSTVASRSSKRRSSPSTSGPPSSTPA